MPKPPRLACLLAVLLGLGAGGRAWAEEPPATPFMLSFVTPLQAPPRDWDVLGLRVSLVYGECRTIRGLDLGTVGHATGHSQGIQLALAANLVGKDGLGFQAAPANYVKGEFRGLQIGAANYAETGNAIQVGIFNGSRALRGLQVGLINVTDTLMGVQVGLVNVIRDNDVPFLPIVNAYF